MLTTFYKTWGTLRAWLILAVILIFTLFSSGLFGFSFDIEFCPPGGEFDQALHNHQNKLNEKSHKKVRKAEKRASKNKPEKKKYKVTEKDKKRATQYEKDHIV